METLEIRPDGMPLAIGDRRFELTLMAEGASHVWLLVEPGRLVLSGAADDPTAARDEAVKAAEALVRLAAAEAA
jgi:hypothetical protein